MTVIFNRSTMKERRQVLRNNMPSTEIILWSKIRRKQIDGCRFRRQYSVGSYVLDFYCPKLKLGIEIDGKSHRQPLAREYDHEREEELKQLGLTLVRFTNEEVICHLNDVLIKIKETSAGLKQNHAETFPLMKVRTQKRLLK